MARIKFIPRQTWRQLYIEKILERVPELNPWPRDINGLYTQPTELEQQHIKHLIWNAVNRLYKPSYTPTPDRAVEIVLDETAELIENLLGGSVDAITANP